MEKKYQSLINLNLWMALAHGLQAALLLILSSDFSRAITTEYLVYDETTKTLVSASRELFNFPFVWGVVAFSLISMTFHLLIATVLKKKYVAGLKKGMNKYRWYEYSLSACLLYTS